MSALVSVVIPCRNEVKSIRATVEGLLASDYPSIEILVIDGMSEDGTREVLQKMSAEDARVRMIDNPQKLTPYAFNLGVVNARGEYVQIVGSRNVVARNYISLLVRTLEANPDVACVGGDYQHVSDSQASRAISLAMESKFGVGMGNYRTMTEDSEVDTAGVPMYRRSIFTDVGMFDENLTRNQDDDYNFRVRARGMKIRYVHAAKVTYLVRGEPKKAFQQFFQYGYFKVFVNRKHRAVTTLRQLIPPLFVLFIFFAVPLGLIFNYVRLVLAVVFVIYVTMGLAMAGEGLSLNRRFDVLGACLVLHLGYGLGYLQGIWDFLITNRRPRERFQRQTT